MLSKTYLTPVNNNAKTYICAKYEFYLVFEKVLKDLNEKINLELYAVPFYKQDKKL